MLGLQHYWLGLRQFPYRSWLLPIDLSQTGYHDSPVRLDEALDRINPAIVLVDRDIDEMMTRGRDLADRNHALSLGFDAFMARRHASLTCVIRDRTYGVMQVWTIPPLR